MAPPSMAFAGPTPEELMQASLIEDRALEQIGDAATKAWINRLLAEAHSDVGAPLRPDNIERLVGLKHDDPARFELVRRELGKRKVRLGALDGQLKGAAYSNGSPAKPLLAAEPEQWPRPVDGAELVVSLTTAVRCYVVLTEHQALAIALWVLHAHAHDAAAISPRLAFGSPTKRCGKTTALSVVQTLVPRALSTSNISSAAVFRTIEAVKPTLMIDEADTFLKDNDELRGILNSGQSRAAARVIRLVGDNHEPQAFSTWAPVAIAMIGRLPETLADRSVEIEMRRKRSGEPVERFRLDRVDNLVVLKRRAARWIADQLERLRNIDPEVPSALHDRAADNWRPLLAIADAAGGDWPAKARAAALALAKVDTEDSGGVMMLQDVRAIFAEAKTAGAKAMFTADVLAQLLHNEDRPWSEWNRGKPISPHQVSKLLAQFGIGTPATVRIGGQTAKGYYFDKFEDAFSRYLPSEAVTPSQALESLAFDSENAVTNRRVVTDEYQSKLADSLSCDGVTDENSVGWQEVVL